MTEKLTKAQQSVLDMLADRGWREATFYEVCDVGGNAATITALVRKGFASSRKVANGTLWCITDAGRLALTGGKE